jgi:hypothetical protein
MGSEKINGEKVSTVEWGSAGPVGRLGWLTSGQVRLRGAGLGCAIAGFGLLIAAQLLPWMSVPMTTIQQDFPTRGGGRIEAGIVQLPFSTELFNFGWLLVLGTVAAALVVGPPVRRVLVAVGLGLAAGQLALLVGITRGILRTTNTTVYRGGFIQTTDQTIQLEIGLFFAYGAVALFALALLLAGGLPRRLRDADATAEEADPALRGPADLTVTPLPATDPIVWSRRDADIDVSPHDPDR